MKRWIRFFIPTLIACTALADITIENVSVEQQAGTKLMDISYDIICTNDTVDISLSVSNGTTAIAATNIIGDVGTEITPGIGKEMTWNAGLDWPTNVADLVYTVSAIAQELSPPPAALAPVAQTGQTNSYQLGDDGDLQAGVEWPEPRFTDNGDGTVLDNLTGLEWVQNPHALAGNSNHLIWSNAVHLCHNLNYAGHEDWNLPSRKELLSIVDYKKGNPALPENSPFTVQADKFYWANTSWAFNTTYAWRLYMVSGYVSTIGKTSFYYAWPVRKQTESLSSPIPKTGQTNSYQLGDDGHLQTGVAWPEPRFTDNGDGTVRDNLTGLEWIKEPHNIPDNSSTTLWSNSISFCRTLSFSGHDDWHLPNIKELETLMHSGEERSEEWLNSSETPFSTLKNSGYWSSTGYSFFPDTTALLLDFHSGKISGLPKQNPCYVWPVRTP